MKPLPAKLTGELGRDIGKMGSTEVSDRDHEVADYYELLQISALANPETIRRMYRFWAARYHPDNPETGNNDMFYRLRTAYEVLSDPGRRAEYDATRRQLAQTSTPPVSSMIDFVDEVEGETNRRLALLAMLYSQRRADPRHPEISLRNLEGILGCPRELLDFTSWYLVQKGYVARADNSDFTITVGGVDYVESQRANLPILNRLLTSGVPRVAETPVERRVNMHDRRMGLPDTRTVKIERRQKKEDRRVNRIDLRAGNFAGGESG